MDLIFFVLVTLKLLTLGFLIFGIFAIVFKIRKNTKMYAIFKPLTTIIIIIIAILIYQKFPSTYSGIIIVALIFSLFGDVFLLKEKYFSHGLSFFLLAHIGFIIAFASLHGFCWNVIPLFFLLVAGGIYYNFLRKDLNKYRIPVAIYMLVIIIMIWQAIGLAMSNQILAFIGIAIASLLFAFSDSLIAYTKFKKSSKVAEVFISITYWSALYIFALAGMWVA